jgi:hypothetical protein
LRRRQATNRTFGFFPGFEWFIFQRIKWNLNNSLELRELKWGFHSMLFPPTPNIQRNNREVKSASGQRSVWLAFNCKDIVGLVEQLRCTHGAVRLRRQMSST